MPFDWKAQNLKDVNILPLIYQFNATQTEFQKDTPRNLTEIILEKNTSRNCQEHFEKKKNDDDSAYMISKYCINLYEPKQCGYSLGI